MTMRLAVLAEKELMCGRNRLALFQSLMLRLAVIINSSSMSEATPNKGMTTVPCRECEKVPRYDYFGFCMDCADENGVSDIFTERVRLENLILLDKRSLSPQEKKRNLEQMERRMKEKKQRGEQIDPALATLNEDSANTMEDNGQQA